MKNVRTRFAPSPTGFMHVGGVRTALFGWLHARAHNGVFILRIEDTDKSREVEGSVEHIIESLDWLGLSRDEDPVKGGEYGPYMQSERLDIYRKYAQDLIDAGAAYADPYTDEEVSAFREQAKAEKRPFLYRNHRPENPSTPDDWYQKSTIRFKTPEIKRYTWQDAVRGKLTAGEEALDDFVLIKADGYPTYNFAHVIDDHLMEISHVIRGEEFIPSTPKFLSLHDALGFDYPIFVTVPPILNMNGGKKLSKRDGARDVLEYRDEGYSPDVINNFLASLGWNDGTEDEVFSLEELVARFSLDRVQKSGAKFDETKLEWLRWQHFERQLANNPENALVLAGYDTANVDFARLAATKSRNLADFKAQYEIYNNYAQFRVSTFDLTAIDKQLTEEVAKRYLIEGITTLRGIDDWAAETIEQELRRTMEKLEATPRAFLNLHRWAIANVKVSPNLFEMMQILGKEETLKRIEGAL